MNSLSSPGRGSALHGRSLRRRPGGEMGEAGAPVPAPVSSRSCIVCDTATGNSALLADNEGRPIAIIAMCPACVAIGDQLGLGATLQTGKA